jgi:hypothetical protein
MPEAAITSREAEAPTCKAGTHLETECDPNVVSACGQHSIDSCAADANCEVICYEGTDCSTSSQCLVNGGKCPVACVPDVPVEPGCYVGPDYLCYDGKTRKPTDYDCCFPPGGGGK